MSAGSTNVDPREVAKFDAAAARWWDPEGEFKPLHQINPLRLDYIERRAGIAGKRIIDVGCGGGLLAEGMAARGGQVLGLDMAPAALQVARLHALETGTELEYRQGTVEDLAEEQPGQYDLVTCMEMLEHVPSPASVIAACAKLVKPGGQVLMSTLHRNPKSYLFAILGAEYLLKMLPKGTHDYRQFIRPSELEAWARDAGLQLRDLTGMSYNPLSREYSLGRDVSVNYLAHFTRVEDSAN
ncbi:bifunctional 2-polyprenyl-6-hydroxyphenol methylase/3-demethylubiquinol 3-O-methyltransferase UbiG [Alkalilimnicola sp. S0819]|uniref:bifunctional 2-polyprenyl-6-hydroxyphenol methylase/3-demethylubiquinol 3-O-methyltransferase UbiG n=1 Tax=Alkalilimnicola sp. S0819 TaxID=2613922 RepID=UPI0012624818|nr:bifunctional 2-polyprenyl-6-hydroxyphenol methylase/3-demethylubiquinol 3-O-methyltransferase UbiG [Alkalilimnicola sp. S0819]KAB7623671.1 bifunctional 2-polyprenyl-6-hydroxyphenol methylase/3-demethylubiquinol 3-O-methyltransferase UbiG [Alkalilimnicola sp. S0819]MPQ16796.1 bifunctional 2-polyprenyl-6-hydroxyphenol methylase/3-demethylubiquinol 3-O-methyltransferase UbiG [Alkalilimnicola sp. S0819]